MSDNNLRINKKETDVSRRKHTSPSPKSNPDPTRRIPKKGHSKAPGLQGAAPYGQNICPKIRARNKRTHQQIRRVCQILNQKLGKNRESNRESNRELNQELNRSLNEREISKALASLVLDKAKAPKNSELFKEIEKLKALLTIFKTSSLRGLEQLAQGKTAKVLVDTKKEIAYKLIEINDGEVGGTFPQEIRIRPEDNQILISGCKKHSLLKMIQAIEIANDHKGPLFTEIAGFTEDGDIILCQPYIKNLESIDMFDDPKTNQSRELNKSIKVLGMKPLGDIGSPFAISKVNDKYAIFDDLHGDNVLKTRNGEIYLVDSLATRYLTKNEINLLKDFLPKNKKSKTNNIRAFEINSLS
jgi:hypothetical protein